MTTGNTSQDIQILLADYAQSREEARYRDRLFYQFLYVVVLVFGGLINAVVIADSELANLFIFIAAFVIFLVLSAATWSIKSSRDAAWKNSKVIEEDKRVAGLLRTNKSIVSAGKKANFFARMHVGTFICWLVTVLTALSLGGIVFASFQLACASS
jgi:hypothetical protein